MSECYMLVLQTIKYDGGGMRRQSNIQTTPKSLYSAAAFRNSKITCKGPVKREPGKISHR